VSNISVGFSPLTVRELFLLVVVCVEFALLVVAICRIQKLNRQIEQGRDK